MKLSKVITENKELNNYVKNEIQSHKNLVLGKDSKIRLILKNKNKLFNKYAIRNKGLSSEYKQLKSENKTVTDSYKIILNHRDNQEFLEHKFKDTLFLYQKQGYRNPDFTTKSNVIKYSPLILENQEQINRFYYQDLYMINRLLKKKWTYNKIYKYIKERGIKFNSNSCDVENEDDDNEKEGINSRLFLNKCDKLVKETFKQKKKERNFKSFDIKNWFKQDLYSDPFLTQGINKYDDILVVDNKKTKSVALKKEISKLKHENRKIKKYINKTFGGNKRYSVYMVNDIKNLENNDGDTKEPIFIDRNANANYKHRSHIKLYKTHRNNIDARINELCLNTISNKNLIKNTAKLLILDSEEDSKNTSPKNKKKLRLNLKKNSILRKNNKKKKNESRNNRYEKIFKLYSGKDSKSLFDLINDIRVPFLKKSILNVYHRTFNFPKIEKVNLKYESLDKKLCQSILSAELSY